ncbi:MAG: IclR family transcriptional regulator [Galactobacter sp.]
MPATGRDGVLLRALRVLEQFDAEHRTLNLTELSAGTGMPRTTVWRIARELVNWGALERVSEERYAVGVRLWEIASLAPRGHGVRETALPYLEDLYQVSGHHVLLAVRDGKEAVLIDRLSSRHATAVDYRIGGRLPLDTTGVGQVLLAHAPAGLRERVIKGSDDPNLRGIIAAVRKSDEAAVRRVVPSETLSVACPVRDEEGDVVAAVSVVVPDLTTHPTSIAMAVRTTAAAISRALGHVASPRARREIGEARARATSANPPFAARPAAVANRT